MSTMFACLHPALEDKTVGSVNANIGAESISGGKTTSAASRNFPKFPNHFNIAKYSFLINNSFTNNFKDIFALRYRIFFFFFFHFHFSLCLLPPTNAHGLAVNSFDGIQD